MSCLIDPENEIFDYQPDSASMSPTNSSSPSAYSSSYESSPIESEENPWQTQWINNGYQENVFELNVGDTAYTETLSNPNPKINQYEKNEPPSHNEGYGFEL